jgi:hypothetical protein
VGFDRRDALPLSHATETDLSLNRCERYARTPRHRSAHAEFSRRCSRIHAAATEALRKADASKGPHRRAAEKVASLRLIRELLATVDVSVGIDTIARFLVEMSGDTAAQRRTKQLGNKRIAVRSTKHTCSHVSPNSHRLRNRQLRHRTPSRAISESTHLCMNKQINLVTNGEGDVGKSFFATNFVQYLKDCGIEHRAIDSDHECFAKRQIQLRHGDETIRPWSYRRARNDGPLH